MVDCFDVINCQFCEFATAPLGPVNFLSPDQESGIHCLIICGILLLTPNNLDETCRHICLLDIRSIIALEVLGNRALQIDIYLLTYFDVLNNSVIVYSVLCSDVNNPVLTWFTWKLDLKV